MCLPAPLPTPLPAPRWADLCDSDDESEPSKGEFKAAPSKAAPLHGAMNQAYTAVVVADAPNFWHEVREDEDADEDVWDCDVQELEGKQIVSIGDHTYELGSLTNDKKRALSTDELKNGWTIKAIKVCPEGARLTQLESVKVFQGPGAMRVKAASEAFKCKLSLRGFGAEGKVENGIFVPNVDSASPVILFAAKHDKLDNLVRAIEWAKARICQIQEGVEDEIEAQIKSVWAAVEASRSESDTALKEAKKEQSNLQKAYVKDLKKDLQAES